MTQGRQFLIISLVKIMLEWIFCIARIIFQWLWQFGSGHWHNHCGWVFHETISCILQWNQHSNCWWEGRNWCKEMQYTVRKRKQNVGHSNWLVSRIVSCYPKSLFGMWVMHYVVHGIIVNIFLMRRQSCWKKSFGVWLLESAKCMAWIFQEGCMWEQTWNNESLSWFKKYTSVKWHGIRSLDSFDQHTCYTK